MTKQIVTCPRCGGKGIVPMLNEQKFDKTGIIEWLELTCPQCNGQGFVLVDTKKLVKI